MTCGAGAPPVEVRIDCDADTLLLRVEPAGPACHTGETACFYRVEGGMASGSGLGLAIAREIARIMDGDVRIESDTGPTVLDEHR